MSVLIYLISTNIHLSYLVDVTSIKEGIQEKVPATKSFVTKQLVMFIEK